MTTAIILAGGLGTRLRSAVPDLPKPMAPIAGRPFLAHQMDHWIAQGVGRFVLSVGYRHEAISGHFGRRYHGAALEYVVETTPLGTGGAVMLAASQLPRDEYTLLLNGDTYFDVPLRELSARARRHDAHWCFSLFRNTDPARYMGVGLSKDGLITALRAPTAALANGGVYLFRPGALDDVNLAAGQSASLENDLFPQLLAAGQRFAGVESHGAFIDIGLPSDYHRAASVLPPLPSEERAHDLAG